MNWSDDNHRDRHSEPAWRELVLWLILATLVMLIVAGWDGMMARVIR